MAYDKEKIKISSRLSGRNPKSGRNLKELLNSITGLLGGECGGHKKAAGCTINREHEEKFIELLKKKLEIEMIKI
jgi:nanoRNase/pAp phosphatase (c-di-AMP/oligoRNAs hydrolase)